MMADVSASPSRGVDAVAVARAAPPSLPSVAALPVPRVEEAAATHEICGLRDVIDALAAGDDDGVIAAAGGGEAFRSAVVTGRAACISLRDPGRSWAVINKVSPFDPIDFRPGKLVMPDGVRSIEGNFLRPDAASALTALVAAARAAGVGEIAMESGYRSYSTQRSSYGRQVSDRGASQADMVSARPGYSEHQSGMAADLVACGAGCGTLDQLAASPRGRGWPRTRGSTAGSSGTRASARGRRAISQSHGTCATSASPWRRHTTPGRGTAWRSSSG